MTGRLTLALLLSLALGACESTTQFEARGGVQVSFATRAAQTTPAPVSALLAPANAPMDDTLVTGSDTLVITQARLVLRQIELQSAETPTCNVEPEPAGCEDVEVGPVLIDLPLNPGAEKRFDVQIPTGTYSRIDLEVHKVSSGDAADSAFVALHPEFADLSIRVDGTFNGTPFAFTNDLNVEQELSLVPPLAVNDTLPINVTIRVDVSTWFVDAQTGALMHPVTGDQSKIVENIKTSLKAFKDDDRDGDETDEG